MTKNPRMTPDMQAKVWELAELVRRSEELKWEILDSGQAGVQSAVAKVYGVSRQAVGKWIQKHRDNS